MTPIAPPSCHYVQRGINGLVYSCWLTTGHKGPHCPRFWAPREPLPGDVDKDTNQTILMGSHPPFARP